MCIAVDFALPIPLQIGITLCEWTPGPSLNNEELVAAAVCLCFYPNTAGDRDNRYIAEGSG